MGYKFEQDPKLRELNFKALERGIELVRQAGNNRQDKGLMLSPLSCLLVDKPYLYQRKASSTFLRNELGGFEYQNPRHLIV